MISLRLWLTALAALGILMSGCSPKPTETTEAPKAAETPETPAVSEHGPATSLTGTEATHAVVGKVEEVDPAGKHIVVRTADGKKLKLHTHAATKTYGIKHDLSQMVRGGAEASKDVGAAVKKDTMVAVHFSEKEGKQVAHQIQHASSETLHKSEIVVDKVEEGGGKIVGKTKNGAEQVFEVSEHATIATGQKIGDLGKTVGQKAAKGAKMTVHYTEGMGKKIAHFIHHRG